MIRWTKEKAEKYVEKVEKGKQEKGLKYLSAKDYILKSKNIKSGSILGF